MTLSSRWSDPLSGSKRESSVHESVVQQYSQRNLVTQYTSTLFSNKAGFALCGGFFVIFDYFSQIAARRARESSLAALE